jgi:hypothetical protein
MKKLTETRLTDWARRRSGHGGLVPILVDITYSSGVVGKAIRYKSPEDAKKMIASGQAEKSTGRATETVPKAVETYVVGHNNTVLKVGNSVRIHHDARRIPGVVEVIQYGGVRVRWKMPSGVSKTEFIAKGETAALVKNG